MVLGKVIKIVPKLGTWRKVFTSTEVVGLIVVLIILFGIGFIWPSKTEKKEESK